MNLLSNLSGFGSSSASPQTTTVTPTVTPTVTHSGVVINKNQPAPLEQHIPVVVAGVAVLAIALLSAILLRRR
ncbi:MAG: hypothetical protein WC683_17435 [bacterium]